MSSEFITKHGLFLSQLIFSLIGVGFSIGMLVDNKDPSIYLPILTSIVGVWTPSPMSRTNQQVALMQSNNNIPNINENQPRNMELAEVTVVRDS